MFGKFYSSIFFLTDNSWNNDIFWNSYWRSRMRFLKNFEKNNFFVYCEIKISGAPNLKKANQSLIKTQFVSDIIKRFFGMYIQVSCIGLFHIINKIKRKILKSFQIYVKCRHCFFFQLLQSKVNSHVGFVNPDQAH